MKRFISTAKHTKEFLTGVNRIGAVIPDDKIFASIHSILKEERSVQTHFNDLKEGMNSLVNAAQSQGKKGLPKSALSKSKSLNQSIEITVPSYDHRESLAYLVLRSIANFAANQVIFKEIKRRCPDFKPASVLDWGTGTGSVFWSASNVWKDDIKEAIGVDLSGLNA
jgi:ribosomal protein RSM22 (predicted rRNA methylase)